MYIVIIYNICLSSRSFPGEGISTLRGWNFHLALLFKTFFPQQPHITLYRITIPHHFNPKRISTPGGGGISTLKP